MNNHVNPAIVIPSKEGIQWHASAFIVNSIAYFFIEQHSRAHWIAASTENDVLFATGYLPA